MKTHAAASGPTDCRTASWVWIILLALGVSPALAAPPTFSQRPGAQSVLVGQNAVFTAAALSDQPVQYQWRLHGVNIAGETKATLNLFCVSPAQSGQVYAVSASNADGSTVSDPAPLEVQVPLGLARPFSWGTDPNAGFQDFAPASYRGSLDAIFEVMLINTGLGSIWGTDIYTDDSSLSTAAVHAGLVAPGERGTVRLKITGAQTSYAGSTRNGVTSNGYGSYAGSYQLLSAAPMITRHPAGQARLVGGTAQFDVQASGPGPLRYQWYFNGNSLAGATGSSLSFPVASTAAAGSYLCTVTDDTRGTATSAYAVLGVLPATPGPPQSQLTSVTSLGFGEIARLVVTGKASAGVIYGTGIYHNSSDVSRAAVHAGLLADAETGVVAVVRIPDQLFFRGESAHGITSNPYNSPGPGFAFLARVPYVTQPPPTLALLTGGTTTLSFTAVHPQPYTVQWRRNGVNVDGQTGPALAITAEAPGSSATYDAVLSAPGAPTLTEPALVTSIDQASGRIYTVTSPSEAAAYFGATRNGITSREYGPYPGMTLLAPSTSPPLARLAAPSSGNLLISGVPGHLAQVWASPSLRPGSWMPVDTVNVTSTAQPWVDPTNPKPPTRFCRVVVP